LVENLAWRNIDNDMKTFHEWLEDTHPEIIEEKWQDWAAAGLMGLGALANGGDAHGAEPKVRADLNDNRPVAAVSQDQGFHDEDVIERNGMVYIRGHVSPREDSPKGRLDAMRVAEVRIQQKAAKYFESKGGKPGFAPPGFKEITNKSDVLSGKIDRVVWAWKIPG
jgi:hypothetical protein